MFVNRDLVFLVNLYLCRGRLCYLKKDGEVFCGLIESFFKIF